MIKVIIPTFNRPDMLRKALRSVADQTAFAQISLVIVSENGGNKYSEKICDEFQWLPIKYVFRDLTLSPLEHYAILFIEEGQGEYNAILHDDDWWGPLHLEQAILALTCSPNAVAYSAGVFEVSGESSTLSCDNNFCFWFGGGYPPLTTTWQLNANEVILASLIHTPARYSAMVARSKQLTQAFAKVLETGNPFDADRMLSVQLARLGDIIYNPIPQVFIRSHPSQDQWSFQSNDRFLHTAKTTEWIATQSEETSTELARKFVQLARRCPEEARAELLARLLQPWCLPRLSEKLPDTEFRVLLSEITDSVEVTTKLDSIASNSNSIEVFLDFISVKLYRIKGDIIWWSKNWKTRFRFLKHSC